jgi:predicted oxidoreductase
MKSENLNLSPLVHGHWRLADWNLSQQELLTLTHQCIELGITSFDHADIYGNYTCESIFGGALALEPHLRKNIQIISKCGIKLTSDKFPQRKVKIYDYSYDYIVSSAEQSLRNFGTDYLDLFLLHRPSPFFNPEEVAKAFGHLKQSGKVRQFGVSNFNVLQFEMLQKYLDVELMTNQVEISTYCLEHFENGNMDFFVKEQIKPMAWSPLAGGQLFKPSDAKGERVRKAMIQAANELELESIDVLAYAWLLKHPAHIIPVIGSGKIERIESAVQAQKTTMSMEQWFSIYNAAKGEELP